MRIFRLLLALWVALFCPPRVHAVPISSEVRPLGDTPAPLPRAPTEDRRPLELTLQARALAPVCSATGRDARCPGLTPAFGGALTALYRHGPYFALGGDALLLRSGPAAGGGGWRRTVELSVAGRVYLLEKGWLDPYLELALGYGSEHSERARAGAPSESRRGPSARIGGGVDFFAASALRVGVSFAYREDLLGPAVCATRRCRPERGFFARGGLLFGLGATVLLGDAL